MKDYIIRATAGKGQIRAFVATTKNMVETARDFHKTSKVATAALGRTITATSIMGLMMKNDGDKLTVIINGGGPIGNIVATANAKGTVKGYVSNPNVVVEDYANGKLNVAAAVGTEGTVRVTKDLGLREPYNGSYPMVSGEIAEDLTYYFALSEQTPSVVALGVLTKEEEVECAGGFIIQLMPDAEEENIAKLEENIAKLESVTTMLSNGNNPEAILNIVLEGLNPQILDTCEVKFDCECSKERVEGVLISIGKQQLAEIIEEDKQAEIGCQFCNTNYLYSEDELKEILKKIN
ncbi:MAG: Hsp33 family molecular chaperone HslO [Paraclostridium sp.]